MIWVKIKKFAFFQKKKIVRKKKIFFQNNFFKTSLIKPTFQVL